jgi:hypothetical protein
MRARYACPDLPISQSLIIELRKNSKKLVQKVQRWRTDSSKYSKRHHLIEEAIVKYHGLMTGIGKWELMYPRVWRNWRDWSRYKWGNRTRMSRIYGRGQRLAGIRRQN